MQNYSQPQPLPQGYKIRQATISDADSINDLLDDYFHPEEHILQHLIASWPHPIDANLVCQEQRSLITGCLSNSQNTSATFVVVHESTSRIAAVALILRSDSLRDLRSLPKSSHSEVKLELLREYFHCMDELTDKAELYKRFPSVSGSVWELYALAVDEGHRRRGLATVLIGEVVRRAIVDDEVEMVFGLFSSPWSARAAKKAGFEEVVSGLELKSCRGLEGRLLFGRRGDDGDGVEEEEDEVQLSVLAVETRSRSAVSQ